MMEIAPLGIEGAWIAHSNVFNDIRGSFREWFKSDQIKESTGIDFLVKQSNVATSARGTIRGVHYSLSKFGQSKWVTCISGHVIDVVVDIRPNSPTFKKYEFIDLRGNDGQCVFVGAGLGHGYLSLEENSTISYLLSSPYSPTEEYEINPMDPELAIKWPLELLGDGAELVMSQKDMNAPSIQERQVQGKLPKK